MRNCLFIIFGLLAFGCFAQKEFCIGRDYYVWAYSGLNLRETPKMDGKVLAIIPYGTKIRIDSLIDMNEFEVEVIESITIDEEWFSNCYVTGKTPNCSIKGKMVKVSFNGLSAFVFNGFLSDLIPFNKACNILNLSGIFETNYGILAKLDKSPKDCNYTNIQIVYKNGFVFYCVNGIDWFSNTYLLNDISFQEGLLVFCNFIKANNSDLNAYKWFIRDTGDSKMTFSEVTGMYNASLRQFDNFLVISLDGSN